MPQNNTYGAPQTFPHLAVCDYFVYGIDLKESVAFFNGGLKLYASKLEISSVRHIVIIDGNTLVQYLASCCSDIIWSSHRFILWL